MGVENEHTEEPKLKRVLTLNSLVFYGLAFMIPLTIFTTYGLATKTTHGMISLTYTVATIAMGFTAFSYSRMVKAYPVAGAAYSYVTKSMNPYIGFLTGWAVLLGYIVLPMLNYVVIGIYLSALIPAIPSWVFIVVAIMFVTLINHLGIELASIVNNTIVWLQILFLVVFLGFVFKYVLGGGGAGTLFDFHAYFNPVEFNKPGVGISAILAGGSILALSFLGFDAISTLSEEAINPERNVGRAILISCISAGTGFVIITYFLQLAWPQAFNQILNEESASVELIRRIYNSGLLQAFFTIVFSAGLLASSLAGVTSASRVLYGMGRDGILPPKIFGRLHPKYKTPTYSILIIGAISLLAIVVPLAIATGILNFGALLTFAMVNFSVIAHYFVRSKKRKGMDIVRYLIMPIIGAAVCLAIWSQLGFIQMTCGIIWLIFGFIYLAHKTKIFRELPPQIGV
ncbi:APC family permease [Clostridium fermenticellae]|uniref:APC family permease n=1 Tax=Clostridium fermenticellae TaxID=2068654 RepID=A0A386H625_9CLOT|nr:APC family permease [Clostridium fermenticellae]AYD41100.1 APC family permease [Clostridium fermenticellae]